MKITNHLGLPEPIVAAVTNDSYSRGDSDISVTSLLKPPRITALEALHGANLEEDASERIWSLVGQAIHTILERANQTGIAERRLSVQVEGWTVSGGMDLVCNERTLSDYKTVTAWKLKGNQVPAEYEQQLNMYAHILRANGEEVKALQVVAILRDWSKLEARRDPLYPQTQVLIVPVKMWPGETAEKFMHDRVILHQQARRGFILADQEGFEYARFATLAEAESALAGEIATGLPVAKTFQVKDVPLPECSPEERWARPDVYALMKQGGKRAVKLYDNEADARSHASTDSNLYVKARPGESVRCAAYCSVSKFCTQYNKQPASQANESEEEA